MLLVLGILEIYDLENQVPNGQSASAGQAASKPKGRITISVLRLLHLTVGICRSRNSDFCFSFHC